MYFAVLACGFSALNKWEEDLFPAIGLALFPFLFLCLFGIREDFYGSFFCECCLHDYVFLTPTLFLREPQNNLLHFAVLWNCPAMQSALN